VTKNKKVEVRGKLIGLVVLSVVPLLQLWGLNILYRYYYYGGYYRPKGGGTTSLIDAGDPVYLLGFLILIPFSLMSLLHVIKQLTVITKLLLAGSENKPDG